MTDPWGDRARCPSCGHAEGAGCACSCCPCDFRPTFTRCPSCGKHYPSGLHAQHVEQGHPNWTRRG